MSITAFEYIKMILEKVSFDAKLFEKELKKAIKQLVKVEIIALKKWCYEHFGKLYNKIIKSAFANLSFRKSKITTIPNE